MFNSLLLRQRTTGRSKHPGRGKEKEENRVILNKAHRNRDVAAAFPSRDQHRQRRRARERGWLALSLLRRLSMERMLKSVSFTWKRQRRSGGSWAPVTGYSTPGRRSDSFTGCDFAMAVPSLSPLALSRLEQKGNSYRAVLRAGAAWLQHHSACAKIPQRLPRPLFRVLIPSQFGMGSKRGRCPTFCATIFCWGEMVRRLYGRSALIAVGRRKWPLLYLVWMGLFFLLAIAPSPGESLTLSLHHDPALALARNSSIQPSYSN